MQVSIRKDDLIKIVTKNRDQHREIFLDAIAAYEATLIEEFQKRIDAIRQKSPFDVVIRAPQPQDHTVDYDRAIAMLAMHTEDVVILDEHDVAQLVQDDWGWRAAWVQSTANYSGKFLAGEYQ